MTVGNAQNKSAAAAEQQSQSRLNFSSVINCQLQLYRAPLPPSLYHLQSSSRLAATLNAIKKVSRQSKGVQKGGGGAVIFFSLHIFWGCLHGLSGTFALFFFRCLVENVLIKLINRKMSCSTVVVVVAINVIAAGREGGEGEGAAAAGEDLHVSFVVCQFNYLDINCQRNDVPSVCVCSQFTCTLTHKHNE